MKEVTKDKVLTLIGFAQKAGKIVSGSTSVELLVGKPEAKLLIIAEDISAGNLKQLEAKCKNSNQKYIIFGEKDRLGDSIGKSQRTALIIKDSNIASAILDIVKMEPL